MTINVHVYLASFPGSRAVDHTLEPGNKAIMYPTT